MKEITWTQKAWDEYLFWQKQDKKTLKRIHEIIKDIEREGPLSGLGKPEELDGPLSGEYSRRINHEDRLVYNYIDDRLIILSCRGHYSK